MSEQYHQIGFRFDQAYCPVGSLVGQAAIQSSAEKRGRNPTSPIKQNVTGKKICWNTKKRSAATKSEEKKIQIKHERRENTLTEISATIELIKKEVILAKLIEEEDMEDLDELAELEPKMFGKIIDSIIS